MTSRMSSAEYAASVAAGVIPCKRCRKAPATGVVSSGSEFADPGPIETALCNDCQILVGRSPGDAIDQMQPAQT